MSGSGAVKREEGDSTGLLGSTRERELLEGLADCRRTLAGALARTAEHADASQAEDARVRHRLLADAYRQLDRSDYRLAAVFERYFEFRAELALANMGLVAYVAKRYRNRGVAYSDLLQDGFCGLLDAIDRFDLAHPTKLSTYAMWWIRQAIQCSVAASAYPVSLTPRHLRALARAEARSEPEFAHERSQQGMAAELVQRIRSATRPAISLDSTRISPDDGLLDFQHHYGGETDRNETIAEWFSFLRPRERQVLIHRFGLGGAPRLSLSQVGALLDVSRERVRQIQNTALHAIRMRTSQEP